MNIGRNLALWVIIALLVFALFNLFQGSSPRTGQQPLAYSDFLSQVESGEVREVTLKGRQVTGVFRDGRTLATLAPEDPNLISRLQKHGVRISAQAPDDGSPTFWSERATS